MAANDLCQLSDVTSALGLSSSQSTDNVLLSTLITAASSFIQSQTGRDFFLNSCSEQRDGNGGLRMPFSQFPVQSVQSVRIDGQPIPFGDAFQNTGYFFSPKSLILNGYRFNRGLGNVQLAYAAGYAAIPADLVQATIDLVLWWYRKMDRMDLASKVMGGETTSFVIREAPPQVTAVINIHKRVGLQ